MAQEKVWDAEYKNPQLVTGSGEPQNDFKRFIKWLRKDRKLSLEGLRVLDLGSGLGKNAIFLAERGANVVGMEISKNAIRIAEDRAKSRDVFLSVIPDLLAHRSFSEGGIRHPEKEKSEVLDSGSHSKTRLSGMIQERTGSATFIHADIGAEYPFPENTFDVVLDVMSSSSLDEKGREIYLREVCRVLKTDGHFFVRTLCKDGDKNAEALLKNSPGQEQDTYVMPGLKLVERVFSKTDFENLYSKYFSIVNLERKSGYAVVNEKTYKRNYWLAYMQK